MDRLRNAIALHHWTRLGRCRACIRTAFLFAAASLLVASAITAAGLGPAFMALGWTAAAALMALWLGHIVMLSAHAARALPGRADGAAMPRRRFLLVFLRTLIFAAAVTSLPRSLRAQSCDCYSDTDCYCPPDFRNASSIHRPARRYAAARTMSAAPGRPSRGAARQTPAATAPTRSACPTTDWLLSAWLRQPLAFIRPTRRRSA